MSEQCYGRAAVAFSISDHNNGIKEKKALYNICDERFIEIKMDLKRYNLQICISQLTKP